MQHEHVKYLESCQNTWLGYLCVLNFPESAVDLYLCSMKVPWCNPGLVLFDTEKRVIQWDKQSLGQGCYTFHS